MELKYSPVFILRSYIWDLIKANTGLKESDYNGLVPIVPLAEEPELTQFSKPYMVYGYTLNSSNDLYVQKDGNMSLAIYTPDFGILTTILNTLETDLGRWDEAAQKVNLYSSTKPAYHGIRFGEIHTAFVDGGSPEDTEGGRQSGVIAIRFTYFEEFEVKTFKRDESGTLGWHY